jgi:hypothetical protein
MRVDFHLPTACFSFMREAVPALAFKFGFAKGTPQFDLEHEYWGVAYFSCQN